MGGGAVRPAPYTTVARIAAAAVEAWETLDGRWALQGIDPHSWPLPRLINAVEELLMRSAADDAERARLRRELNPPATSDAATRRQATGGRGVSKSQVGALMAEVAAEDAKYN